MDVHAARARRRVDSRGVPAADSEFVVDAEGRIEFASPESAAAALRASDERRALPENHVARRSEEKTHPRVALLHAANDAVRYLDRAAAE